MSDPDQLAETAQRIRVILRRDLKLGAAAALPDEMPLSGGDFDLDSLDILLLVASIEKEFGIKIPDVSIGRAAFASIATLAQFVEQHRPAA